MYSVYLSDAACVKVILAVPAFLAVMMPSAYVITSVPLVTADDRICSVIEARTGVEVLFLLDSLTSIVPSTVAS